MPHGIDVLDSRHPKFLNEIALPTSLGANGVLSIRRTSDDSGEDQTATLVVGGNDSHTYFVNLTTDLAHAMGAPITVNGGKGRADEFA